jgi:plasmid stability protein
MSERLTAAPEWFHIGPVMNITIKDIPVKLHRKLKARAKANNRSLNREVIDILETADRPIGIIDKEAFLREVRELRSRFKGSPMSEDFVDKAKNWGRP